MTAIARLPQFAVRVILHATVRNRIGLVLSDQKEPNVLLAEACMKISSVAVLTIGLSLMGAIHARGAGAGSPATRAAAGGKPTIFVCGDSTAKNSGAGRGGQQIQGWGTPLAEFFDAAKATVNNVGHAGTSSRTYYNNAGDWPSVLTKIKAGDYVLIVFGINDGGPPRAVTDRGSIPGIGDDTVTLPRAGGAPEIAHTYGWYMSKMATDAIAKGAHPIYLTVTARNIWTNPNVRYNDGTPAGPLPANYDPKQDKIERGTSRGQYTQWTKDVAAKLHLPVFDLTNFSCDKYEAMGRETVNALYSDHNHTFIPGAKIVAESVVSGLKAFKDSPFIPLLSEEGKAVKTADAKYVNDNLPGAASRPTTAPAGN
jgi:lysophospholipase L1-like esterase